MRITKRKKKAANSPSIPSPPLSFPNALSFFFLDSNWLLLRFNRSFFFPTTSVPLFFSPILDTLLPLLLLAPLVVWVLIPYPYPTPPLLIMNIITNKNNHHSIHVTYFPIFPSIFFSASFEDMICFKMDNQRASGKADRSGIL